MNITPTKHDDGTETVRLWGKTFDVTKKRKLTAFKREFKIVRPKAKKKKMDVESTITEIEAFDIVQGDHSIKGAEATYESD